MAKTTRLTNTDKTFISRMLVSSKTDAEAFLRNATSIAETRAAVRELDNIEDIIAKLAPPADATTTNEEANA